MNRLAYVLLWLFVFATPWELVLKIEGVGTISRLVGMAALAVGIAAVLRRGQFRPLTLFHVAALFFVLWGGITIFWTAEPEATVARFWRNVQIVGQLWLIWELAATPERRMGLFQAYVLGASISATSIIVNYMAGNPLVTAGGGKSGRFGAGEFSPNAVAFLLVLSLPMAWHLGTTHRLPLMRLVNRAYLLVAMLAITLTASRGALILSAIALLIVPLTISRLGLGMKLAMAVFLVASAAITWRYIPEHSLARLATTGTELMEGTMNERRVIWRAGVHLIPLHPLGGIGAGAFSRAVVPFLGYEKAPHNAYLSVMVEQGIVGLSLFILVFVCAFLHARDAPSRERPLLLILLVTLIIGLTPRAWEAEKHTWLILALLLTPAVTVRAAAVPTGMIRRERSTRLPAGA